jgi:hypothetical protein
LLYRDELSTEFLRKHGNASAIDQDLKGPVFGQPLRQLQAEVVCIAADTFRVRDYRRAINQ